MTPTSLLLAHRQAIDLKLFRSVSRDIKAREAGRNLNEPYVETILRKDVHRERETSTGTLRVATGLRKDGGSHSLDELRRPR